jgi:putative selenate reductase
MAAVGARTIDDYILDARGLREAAIAATSSIQYPASSIQYAGWLNTSLIAGETAADERYTAAKNRVVPRRIDSHLVLFDCISCDKCVPVCPNDANFMYEAPPVDLRYRDVEVAPDGTIREVGNERAFTVERTEQIANFADFCNYCGNCDTFCPEWDGPYLKKPNFFGSRASFDAAAQHDGFLLEGEANRFTLHGRINGQPCRLEMKGVIGRYDDGTVTLEIEGGKALGLAAASNRPTEPHRVDMDRFHALATLLAGIINSARVHQVNIRLLADS